MRFGYRNSLVRRLRAGTVLLRGGMLVLGLSSGAAAASAATPHITATSTTVSPTSVITTSSTPTTGGSPTSGPVLTPTIAPNPVLKVISVTAVRGGARVELACVFSACEVSADLATYEHVQSGTATSLSGFGATGAGTRTAHVGSDELRMLPGTTQTLTLPLNATGLHLLASFHSLPAVATIVLTNGKPVKSARRSLTVT